MSSNAAVFLPAEDVGGAVSGEGGHVQGQEAVRGEVHQLRWRCGVSRRIDGDRPRPRGQLKGVGNRGGFTRAYQKRIIQSANSPLHGEGGGGILDQSFDRDGQLCRLGKQGEDGTPKENGEASD